MAIFTTQRKVRIMGNASRLGDYSFAGVPKPGRSSRTHTASGPATTGSPNVIINNRAAVRVDDRGMYHGVGGSGAWRAAHGAPRVLINGRRAHRTHDENKHRGGVGEMLQGSPNVVIG